MKRNHIYLQIYNHLNRNYYKETALLNIKIFFFVNGFNIFQSLVNEKFDNTNIKSDSSQIYHQQGANLNDPDQNIEFIFGEDINYHQIGHAYLEFHITVRDSAGASTNASNTRLINKALAFCFKEAKLATTGGSDLKHNKYVGQDSTIMRLLTSEDGDLSS